MVSEAISTAILVVAGVIVATVIASAFYSQIYAVDSFMRIVMKSSEDRVKTNIKIVHASLNTSIDKNYLVIFVKNIGLKTISHQEIMMTDLYIGSGLCNTLLLYDQSNTQGYWEYMLMDLNGDSLWSPSETLIIRIYNTTAFYQPICVKIVLPNGVEHEAYATI